MRDCLARRFQDYQDGVPFRGRSLFGIAAQVAAVGYRVGYHLKRIGMARGHEVFRPRAAVIGVGSLVVGGSGKTSLVDYIAGRVLQSGRRVAILTRGYQRKTKARIMIDPGRADDFAVDQTGDEPLMLAHRLPAATIIVDEHRAQAARDVEKGVSPDVFLLDDAAQYPHIAYDCRVFTFAPVDLDPPFRLLPAGRWREPAARMRAADAIAIVGESACEHAEQHEQVLRVLGFLGPVVYFAYELASWRSRDGTPAEFLALPEGCKVGAFCGLARPAQFFSWLSARGIGLAQTWRFADHHRYSTADVDHLHAQAARGGLDFLLTTEKDAVKLARFTNPGVRIIYPAVRLSPVRGGEMFDRFVEAAIARNIHN